MSAGGGGLAALLKTEQHAKWGCPVGVEHRPQREAFSLLRTTPCAG